MPRDDSFTKYKWVGRYDLKQCSAVTYTRSEGVQWCFPHWNELCHVGEVPTSAELRRGFDQHSDCMSLTDLEYDPARDHEHRNGSWLRCNGMDLVHGCDYYEEPATTVIPAPVPELAVAATPFAPSALG